MRHIFVFFFNALGCHFFHQFSLCTSYRYYFNHSSEEGVMQCKLKKSFPFQLVGKFGSSLKFFHLKPFNLMKMFKRKKNGCSRLYSLPILYTLYILDIFALFWIRDRISRGKTRGLEKISPVVRLRIRTDLLSFCPWIRIRIDLDPGIQENKKHDNIDMNF